MEKLFSLETFLVVAAAIVAVWILFPFGTAILLAGISAYILFPMVSKLRSWIKLYDLALLLSLAVIIAPAVVFLNYIAGDVTPLINAISGISESFESIFVTINTYATQYGFESYFENIPALIERFELFAKAQLRALIPNIPHIAISIAVYLFSTYYLLKDGERIGNFIHSYAKSLPKRDGEALLNMTQGLKSSFDVLFFSYVTLSLVVMVMAWIGYEILGVPFAGFFAFLTGIFAFLPLVGVWVGYGFVALYYYTTTSDILMTGAILAYGVIVLSFLPEFILRPVFGSRVGQVHPLTILLGFFGGPAVFGIKGFLLGPILLVIAERIIKGYAEFNIAAHKDKTEPEKTDQKKVSEEIKTKKK